MPTKGLSHIWIMPSSFGHSLLDQETNLSFSGRSESHTLARWEADEIMTPPPAIALNAGQVHYKMTVQIHSDPPSNEKGNLQGARGRWKRERTGMREMSADGGERRTVLLAGWRWPSHCSVRIKINNMSSGRTSRDGPAHSWRRAEEGGDAGLMGEGHILI